ncbi:MAG: hypothetical protein JNK43_06130, partial [Ignavibacteria bacterium]|nr:hypothetical protein [Ignavibacteria bacterium]
ADRYQVYGLYLRKHLRIAIIIGCIALSRASRRENRTDQGDKVGVGCQIANTKYQITNSKKQKAKGKKQKAKSKRQKAKSKYQITNTNSKSQKAKAKGKNNKQVAKDEI